MTSNGDVLERQIAEWRMFVGRGKAIAGSDVEELEGRLRDHIEALTGAGLAADEAFLVAVKRIGSLNALSREFAREHSERLWRQLVPALGGQAAGRDAGALQGAGFTIPAAAPPGCSCSRWSSSGPMPAATVMAAVGAGR